MCTTECCSAIKNTVPPFGTTWMDLESIVLSEISQKGKYDMISLTSHRQRQGRRGGGGGGGERKWGDREQEREGGRDEREREIGLHDRRV